MRVLLTGADGFLGWHTRNRLAIKGGYDVVAVDRPDWHRLPELAADVDAVIHLAAVNDHTESSANARLASDLARAVEQSPTCRRIVFSNTIHTGSGTPYGQDKAHAAEILGEVARRVDGAFVNVRLPNLFGEHARPHYNTFVATFIDAILKDEQPQVFDRAITLLHAQEAAETLIESLHAEATLLSPVGTPTSVATVYQRLTDFNDCYRTRGEIPQLESRFEVSLFNSFRAAMFPAHYPLPLTRHTDARGSFVETVRVQGSSGQTSYSTTFPDITRGNHYHTRKIERFVVLSGEARISLRRTFTDEMVHFDVSGENPCIVDMPTMWTHNITNTGSGVLTTLFWVNELFDPADPDTFAEAVQ